VVGQDAMTRLTIAVALAAAPCLVVCGLLASPVLAQPPTVAPTTAPAGTTSVTAQVVVILAREVDGAMDPRLEGLSALREAPFSAFHSMDIWSEHSLTLTQGVPVTVDLPNGRVIQLVLEEVTADGRNHVRVSINRREQSDYLPVLEVAAPPGDPFFVAGQNFMGGMLVIGVSLGRHASGPPSLTPRGTAPAAPPPSRR
jgi:hypothetical protein